MTGQILDYSVQKNEGVISADDGSRYTFSGSEWRIDASPARGMRVDFEVQANSATEVYRALGATKPQTKSKAAVTLWGIFLGWVGAHKFYMGSWGWGIIYLLTFSLAVPAIVGIVEWIRYVLMSDEEFYAKVEEYQSRNPGPFGFFW